MRLINVNCAETISSQMTSTHHFIDISQNILNLWIRLIFPETRHLGLQFEHKNETIPVRIESYMIIWSWFYMLLQQLQENRILACFSLPPIFPFNALYFPQAKMRSRFIIFCQPLLNGIPFIFPPPLLYILPLSFIPETKKNLPLFFSLEF